MKTYAAAFSLFTFCVLSLITFASPAGATSAGCLICHNAMSGKAVLSSGEEIDLGVDGARYQSSVHGFLQCTDCHKKFDENPHGKPSARVPADIAALAGKIGNKATVDPVAYAACSDCHPDTYTKVIASVHGRNIADSGERDGALCLDCHGSPHYIAKSASAESPASQFRVVETCGACHGDDALMKKYGIVSDIMGTYHESFHGRKHHLGHTKAPTCVNCHGAHDIRNDTDPASPVYGANRIDTCGACHEGANEKFISGVSHKPVGPIPHYAEKGLILLTLSVFAFIVAHVFLDAFADIRDAIFRRRRTGNDAK